MSGTVPVFAVPGDPVRDASSSGSDGVVSVTLLARCEPLQRANTAGGGGAEDGMDSAHADNHTAGAGDILLKYYPGKPTRFLSQFSHFETSPNALKRANVRFATRNVKTTFHRQRGRFRGSVTDASVSLLKNAFFSCDCAF